MLTEECLAEIGKLFERAQYQKCEKSLLKYLSDHEQNNGAARNNVSCDDYCKNSHLNENNDVARTCSATLRCIFQQNGILCSFLYESVHKKSSEKEVNFACERFNRLLQDVLGWAVCDHHSDIELVILHNYLSTLLSHHICAAQEWSENAFMLISLVLNRAFEVRTGSVASVHRPVSEEIISLMDGILLHTENMSEQAIETLHVLCFAIFYLLIIHNFPLPVHYVKRIMSKMEHACQSKKQQKCRRPGFVCLCPSNLVTPGIPPHNDMIQLLLACNYMAVKDTDATTECLEKITYSGWEHFIGYIKAFLLFKEKQFDLALENSWSLWKTKEKVENWMVSRLSNFIGCCLFKKGCISMSVKWFQKSVNSDFSYLLPLWNLASAFKSLGKKDASIAVLENLEKASTVCTIGKHSSFLFCNYLWLQDQPEITHVQALYLLANQCLSFCHYRLAAEHFTKLLQLLKENPLEDLPCSVHFSVSLLDSYVEACYAFLRAEMYEDCLRTSRSAAECYPTSNCRKQNESLFSWDMDKKLLKTPHINHHNKRSFSIRKFSTQHVLALSNHCSNPGQGDIKQNNLFCSRNDSDETSLKSDSSVAKVKVGKSDQRPHDHVKPYRIMHLMIEASAKYSLNCAAETVEIFKSALSATRHFHETEENASTSVFSKDQDDSAAKSVEESCPLCSNLISSLRSQIYNNLAVIFISRGHLKEAAHNLRIAVMHDSNNIDAIYNYCLLQVKLNKVQEAQSFCEASKVRCDRIKSILESDDCNTSCAVTTDLLKSLDEVFSTKA